MSILSKTQEYQQIDRILRIIYKELSYDSLIGEDIYSPQFKDLFSLRDNSDFKNIVINKYMTLYPDNYNEDSISNIITYFYKLIELKFDSSNAIYLLFYVSQSILKVKHLSLEVNHDDLLEWDGLINKVSSDIYISSFNAQNRLSITSHSIQSNNKEVQMILSQGIADNHLHLKASGYTVEMNWYHYTRLSIFSKKLDDFAKINHVFRGEFKGKAAQEKNILILRKTKLLRDYLKQLIYYDDAKIINRNMIYQLLETKEDASFLAYSSVINKNQSHQNIDGGVDLNIERLRTYYQDERDFLTSLFCKVYQRELDSFDLSMFNLYILMSNQIKFMLIQDNIGMGFTKFKHYEDIKEIFIPETMASSTDLIRTVFKKYYLEKHVRTIEVRIGPKSSVKEYHQFAKMIEKINKEIYQALKIIHPELEEISVSIIVHFIKIKFDSSEKFLPRFSKLRFELMKKSEILKSYLESGDRLDKKNLRFFYSGIDAANYEVHCPPEIFGPAFRKIKGVKGCRRIGQTYHVGEEFSSLLSGLRAIDEALEFLNYEPNDRLGHALALGINVLKYFSTKRGLIQEKIQEYFDDIVWAYYKLDSEDYSMKNYLENQFYFVRSKYMISQTDLIEYGRYNIRDFYLAWVLRGCDPYEIHDIHFNSIKIRKTYKLNYNSCDFDEAVNNPNARSIYLDYHFKDTIRSLDSLIYLGVIDNEYIQVVTEVQKVMLRKVSQLRIFVEANPTSNKKISSIQKYSDLPLFNMSPINESEYRISSSINTDDSSIFQTNLSNEYYIIAAALIRDGYDSRTVYNYIDQLAKSSKLHTFTDY